MSFLNHHQDLTLHKTTNLITFAGFEFTATTNMITAFRFNNEDLLKFLITSKPDMIPRLLSFEEFQEFTTKNGKELFEKIKEHEYRLDDDRVFLNLKILIKKLKNQGFSLKQLLHKNNTENQTLQSTVSSSMLLIIFNEWYKHIKELNSETFNPIYKNGVVFLINKLCDRHSLNAVLLPNNVKNIKEKILINLKHVIETNLINKKIFKSYLSIVINEYEKKETKTEYRYKTDIEFLNYLMKNL